MDALDTKAGVVLGFSGALVALASGDGPLLWIGRLTAAAAALLALWAYVPRRLPVPDIESTRRLLDLDEETVAIRLMDAEIRMIRGGDFLVRRKSLRIKVALLLLVLAIGLTAISGVVK